MTIEASYVIVGASLAGASAAQTLRDEGFTGRIVLIGDEPERPYERPPLSKGFLLGETPQGKLYVHDADWYRENAVDLLLGRQATRLDRDAREVVLADGERVGYTRLLLTTGASPRHLDVPGAALDGVHYLRRVEDAERLAADLRRGGHVVVVGGGWIGLESAAAARTLGCQVTVIEPQPAPLFGSLGPQMGAYFAEVHRRHGTELLLGRTVQEFRGNGHVSDVITENGAIHADAVVVGVGVRPNAALAEASGLAVQNGIVVDSSFGTEDPDIYAAGDVANVFNPRYGQHIRVEHWANARKTGAAAAKSMAGQEVRYDAPPYFFTDQYDLGMEFTGWFAPGSYDSVITRGDPATHAFHAFWITDNRVVAGMHVNQWDEGITPVQELLGTTVDPDQLTDPTAPWPG